MSSLSRTLGARTLASTVWFGGEAPAQAIDQIRGSKTLHIA